MNTKKEEIKKRGLAAIRQRSFCGLKSMKPIKFPARAYYAIHHYAQDVGLPAWEAVFQLVEKEDDLLRQARIKQSFVASNQQAK